jgi:hypothetical protein
MMTVGRETSWSAAADPAKRVATSLSGSVRIAESAGRPKAVSRFVCHRTSRRSAIVGVLIALLAICGAIHAHTPDTSYLRVVISGGNADGLRYRSLELRFTFDLATLHRITRLDGDYDGKVTRAEAEAGSPDIADFLREAVTLEINEKRTDFGEMQPLGWPVDVGEAVDEKNYSQTLVHFTFKQQTKRSIQDIYVLFEWFAQLGDGHRVVADFEQEGHHEVVFTLFEPDYVYDTFWQQGESPMRFLDGVEDVWKQWWLPGLLALLAAATVRWSLLKWAVAVGCVGLAFWVTGNMWADPLLRAGPWKAGVIAGMALVAIITIPLRTLARSWRNRSTGAEALIASARDA